MERVLPITTIFVDNIPPMSLEDFSRLLRERKHSPVNVKFFPRHGRGDRARVEFATAKEAKDARFDIGGLVVTVGETTRKLWAAPFNERKHVWK